MIPAGSWEASGAALTGDACSWLRHGPNTPGVDLAAFVPRELVVQTTLDDVEVEAMGCEASGPSDCVAPGFNFEHAHHTGSPEAQRFGDLGWSYPVTFSGRAPDLDTDDNGEFIYVVTQTGVGAGTRSLLQDSGFPAQDGSRERRPDAQLRTTPRAVRAPPW